MDVTDTGDRRNGEGPATDEAVAAAPAPEAAEATADVTATGGGMRSTDATPPDQPAPRPIDLVAAAPAPRRGIVAVVVAAVLVALLVRRLRRP